MYDGKSTQTQLYEGLILPQVKAVLSGINATVFAYGQTGSGKTYTMQGDAENPMNGDTAGMIQRAAKDIFKGLEAPVEESDDEEMQSHGSHISEDQIGYEDSIDDDISMEDIDLKTEVFVSIYQIYNETVNDLLAENTSAKLKVR